MHKDNPVRAYVIQKRSGKYLGPNVNMTGGPMRHWVTRLHGAERFATIAAAQAVIDANHMMPEFAEIVPVV